MIEVFPVFHQVAVAYHGYFLNSVSWFISLFPSLLWWNCLYILVLFLIR